tara:strand:- start:520 stop:744 length:225 start_codon:yes stop_codon:yes gene_type:complete
MSHERKIVVYAEGNVVSSMVRTCIVGEDGFNYHKNVRRFFKYYPNLKVGQTVIFAGVEMKVVKLNSGRIKLNVI